MANIIRETAGSRAARDNFVGVVDELVAGKDRDKSPQFAIEGKIAGLDLSALKGSLSGEEFGGVQAGASKQRSIDDGGIV